MRKSSYLLNDMKNFNEIYRKIVAYDDIKSYKKETGFHPLSIKHFLEKRQGVQIDPPPVFLGLTYKP